MLLSDSVSEARRSDGVRRVLEDPSLIRPVFQPIVDLRTAQVCGFEMLARFMTEPPGSPPEWFDAAHGISLGAQLEATLVAIGVAARERLPVSTFLSINVSPDALLSSEVTDALAAAPDLARIVIEITERSPVADYAPLIATLDRLRAAGASIAVDDAGAGYASLQHVMRLRPQFVKLDRDLIAGVHLDPVKLALIEAVGGIAGRLDARVVADGIERQAEHETLAQLAIPLGQGYLYGRPKAEIDPRPVALPVVTDADEAPLARLVIRSAPVVREGGSPPAHADDAVVVLDELDRPTAMLVHDGGDWTHRRDLLRVMWDDALADAAHRAMTRPPEARFDPICCCHPDGRYAGLIRLERLVRALADHARAA